MSVGDKLDSLQWIPLAGRHFAHRCSAVQNAIKEEILEHLETFKITLRDLEGHNIRNSYLSRIPKPKTEWGKRTTYYRYISDWSTQIFKRDLKTCLRAKNCTLQTFILSF